MNSLLRISASNNNIRAFMLLHKYRSLSGVSNPNLFTHSGRTPGVAPEQPMQLLKKNFCSSPNDDKFPSLTDFPVFVRPRPFEMIRHRIMSSLVIRRYFDKDFHLDKFLEQTLHDVVRVSGYMAEGKLVELDELVTPNVLGQIKENIRKFSPKHMMALGVEERNIFARYTHNVEVIIPGKDNIIQESPPECYVQITVVYLAMKGRQDSDAYKSGELLRPFIIRDFGRLLQELPCERFVEKTVIYHVLKGYHDFDFHQSGEPFIYPDFSRSFTVLNYRFIRNYSPGLDSYWIIEV